MSASHTVDILYLYIYYGDFLIDSDNKLGFFSNKVSYYKFSTDVSKSSRKVTFKKSQKANIFWLVAGSGYISLYCKRPLRGEHLENKLEEGKSDVELHLGDSCFAHMRNDGGLD